MNSKFKINDYLVDAMFPDYFGLSLVIGITDNYYFLAGVYEGHVSQIHRRENKKDVEQHYIKIYNHEQYEILYEYF